MPSPNATSSANPWDALAGDQWYGVYMGGKKVGWGHIWFRVPSAAKRDGAVDYETGTHVELTMFAHGRSTKMSLKEVRKYGAQQPFGLTETTFEQSTALATDQRVARPNEGGGLSVERTLSGKAQPKREVGGPVETLTDLMATMPPTLEGLKVGDKRTARLFDWQSEGMTEVHAEVLERTKTLRAGVAAEVAKLQVRYPALGIEATTTMADGGVVLRMTMGSAIELRLQDRASVQSDLVGLDIVGSWIRPDRVIAKPHELKTLELEVRSPNPIELPQSARQRVVSGPDGVTRVRVDRAARPKLDASDNPKWLASTARIDHRHPTIEALVSEVLPPGSAITDRQKATKLATWVERNLRKALATDLPSASKVAELKVGDCTEHTWLLVALLRAAGIPARPVYGLAYVGSGTEAFGYHAWVEVGLNGHWEAMDPTWGQLQADPTHVVLGHDLGAVAMTLGDWQIRVVKAVR